MRRALLLLVLPLLVLGCRRGAPDSGPGSAADTGDKPATGTPADSTTAPAAGTLVAGAYAVTGANPDGTPYNGTLNVTARDDVYQFAWETGSSSEGIAIADGDAVAVGYGGSGCGAVIYRVSGNTLTGRWGMYGNNTAGTERGERAADVPAEGGSSPAEDGSSPAAGSPSSIAGTYQVEGTNPDNSPYRGTLTVDPDADAFELTWQTGGQSAGVGLQDGDVLASSYGGEGCGVALYRTSANALTGRWTTTGANGIGTETATRQ